MAQKRLSIIKRKIESIEQEGYLSDCWVAAYKPRGTARGNMAIISFAAAPPLMNYT
jgi:hypothetical protein